MSQLEPGSLNFDGIEGNKIRQGATWVFEFQYMDANGALVDLSGYTIKMQIRQSVKATTVLAEMSTANSRITFLPQNTIKITLPSTVTTTMPSGRYVYDILATSGGISSFILEGEIVVAVPVTKG